MTPLSDRERVRRLSNFINEAAGPETALLWAHERATFAYPALPGGWWFDNLVSASRKLRR